MSPAKEATRGQIPSAIQMLNLFSSDLRQSHPGLSHAALWDRWTGQQACTQAHVFTLGRSQGSGDYACSISCPTFSLYNFTAVTSGIKMRFQVNFTNLHVSFISLQNEAVILWCVIFFFQKPNVCLDKGTNMTQEINGLA